MHIPSLLRIVADKYKLNTFHDTQEATLFLRVPGMLRGRYQRPQKCIRNKAAHVSHACQSASVTGAIFKRSQNPG